MEAEMKCSTSYRAWSRLAAAIVTVIVMSAAFMPARGQDTDPAAYRHRRERLAKMAKEGIVVVQSVPYDQRGLTEYLIDDSDNHDFLYLTGLPSTRGTLVLLPQSTDFPEVLFVPAALIDAARSRSGVATVLPDDQLNNVLGDALTDYSMKRMTERRHKLVSTEMARVLSLTPKKPFYFNYPRYISLAGDLPARIQLAERLRMFSPDVELRNATPFLTWLRVRHDSADLAIITAAMRIGTEGLIAAMKACKPGAYDYQVDAAAEYAFKMAGASRLAYPSLVYISPFTRTVKPLSAAEIAASTEPLSALHQMEPGDLVMLDAGAEYHHYATDLSRMVPVSGTFNPEQRRLYEAVLAAHHAAVAAIRPGATFKQVHEAAVAELRSRGLDQYFTFGTSHLIGMDAHDPGNYEEPLAPGMILTVEPGVIINPRNITIHVEDMILVTDEGHKNLSESVPIETADVEKLLAVR
jgi:Xaa-Pro aminopeptidase